MLSPKRSSTTGSLDSAKVLVITGNLNREELVTKLEAERAIVDQLQVYKTEKTDLSAEPGAADFRARGADAILFASSSAVQSFVDQAGALKLGSDAKRPLAGSIGPQTSETMKKVGMPIDFEAKTPSLDALVDALVKKLGEVRTRSDRPFTARFRLPAMIDGIRFKVCGLTSLVDAEFADRCGADYLGFIFYPKSPRFISLEQFRAMAPRLPDRRKVAVSVEPTRRRN